jgi:hypothetical protein
MITHRSILAFIFLISITQLESCYTIIKKTEPSPNEVLEQQLYSEASATGESVIEGTVKYVEQGGTREISRFKGFILENFRWTFNYPSYHCDYVYLRGNVDSSYINSYVLILGTYQTSFGNELNHATRVSFNINKIMLR